MKNVMFSLVIIVVAMMMSVTGCKKNTNGSDDFTIIDAETSNSQTALNLSKAFNDTLVTVYDTVKIHKNNLYCIKYDKLYHKNDSMFNVHYNMFGDEMYKNGIMMKGYTPGSMMGGMMNSSSMMNTQRLHSDTTMMNGYYKNMQQLHSKHQTYHNGIYN